MGKTNLFKNIKENFFSKVNLTDLNLSAIFVIVSFVSFLGILIPIQVMSMAPDQFVIRDRSPLVILFSTTLVYGIVGLVILTIYFIIKKENIKRIILNVYIYLLVYLIINYFAYGTVDAVMNNLLIYDADIFIQNYDELDYIKTIIIILISVPITYFLSKCEKLRKDVLTIILICIALFSVFKGVLVHNATDKIAKNFKNIKMWKEDEITPIYNFSTNNKNVVVFMIDRFTGKYFEQVINNYPELKKKFQGFIFYPNTLSFGPQTTSGSPGLFGGYEYIPNESDKRTDELVVDKHNEALKVMPKMFGDNGFDVVVSNLPDVNYQDSKRPSPFKDLKNFSYRSYVGRIDNELVRDNIQYTINTQRDHFVQYPFMMFLPFFLRPYVYNDGNYLINLGDYGSTMSFLNYLVAFKNMNKMTGASSTKNNKAIILNNEMPHESYNLSYPDFEVTRDRTQFADETKIHIMATTSDVEYYNYWDKFLKDYDYYDTCVRATIDLGNWLDYLRKLKVYDNTRIIITSDHGVPPGWVSEKSFKNVFVKDTKYKYNSPELWFSSLSYNPIFLYKDFNLDGDLKVSNEFMTNADTPYIAMNGLIKDMKNPYTGKIIDDSYKNREKFVVAYLTEPWAPAFHWDENQYETVNRTFLSFEGKNIFDLDKWNALINYNSLVCDVHRNIVKHDKTKEEKCGLNIISDYYECQDCKMIFKDENATERIYNISEVQKNIPHKFTNYISNNDETEDKHGTMTAKCDYGCGAEDTKGDPNAKLNHEKYIVENKELPSFNESGHEGTECSYCGKKLSDREIPKLHIPELSEYVVEFNGNKIDPTVTVIDGEDNTVNKEDFRVKYNKDKNPGFAYANVVMRKPYGGEINVYYAITPEKVEVSNAEKIGEMMKISIKNDINRNDGFEIEASTDSSFSPNNSTMLETTSKVNSKGILNIYNVDEKYNHFRIRTYVDITIDENDDSYAINDSLKEYVTHKRVYSEWTEFDV